VRRLRCDPRALLLERPPTTSRSTTSVTPERWEPDRLLGQPRTRATTAAVAFPAGRQDAGHRDRSGRDPRRASRPRARHGSAATRGGAADDRAGVSSARGRGEPGSAGCARMRAASLPPEALMQVSTSHFANRGSLRGVRGRGGFVATLSSATRRAPSPRSRRCPFYVPGRRAGLPGASMGHVNQPGSSYERRRGGAFEVYDSREHPSASLRAGVVADSNGAHRRPFPVGTVADGHSFADRRPSATDPASARALAAVRYRLDGAPIAIRASPCP